jgi:hypothetical protein
MNQWNFVIAAYVISLLGVGLLILWGYTSMRRAEAAADKFRK